MRPASSFARWAVFLRSFLIQGSWNNRTMIGGGFGFAMLPQLRRLFSGDPEAFQSGLERHSEHFNAHPYLSSLALGAVCRMEEEGRDPQEIRRFKLAVRGPLGGLGDALVWVGWRPATILAALLMAVLRVSPEVTVVTFLVLYNAGHLALRTWGFTVGMRKGSQIGEAIRSVGFPLQAERLASLSVLLLGGVVGVVLARSWSLGGWPLLVLGGTAGTWGFWLGGLVGQQSWRWTLWALSIAIGGVTLVGWIV